MQGSDHTRPVEVNRARPNHAIWEAEAMARTRVPVHTLLNGMGKTNDDGEWCIRDGVTGAHLRVWPASFSHDFLVAWLDGPRAPGSGRRLAELMCGEVVGGRLESL